MEARLARLESVLASQHGLVTSQQMKDAELSVGQARRLVHQRVLRRVRRGVFGLVGAPDTWERGLLAVVLCVDGSIASHSAGARLWRFEPRPEDRFEVTVTGGYQTPLVGVALHRSLTLGPEDVAQVDGIPCTTFERTLCDCTTVLSEYQLGRALDDGLRRGVASIRRLAGCSERLESGPGRRMSVVRSLLAARDSAFEPGGSRSELHLLEVFRAAGLPEPVQQLRINVDGRTYRPDFAWPDYKVFAEYYGLPFHIGASAVTADSERLTNLVADGWLPLVFTSASSDRVIVERTRAALRQRGVLFDISA